MFKKVFIGGDNQYIRVTQQDAGWYHQKKTNTFSKDEVFAMIDLVVDNLFFRFGDRVHRQCMAIPMTPQINGTSSNCTAEVKLDLPAH